jgi:sortase (surface protein transpeptidase)
MPRSKQLAAIVAVALLAAISAAGWLALYKPTVQLPVKVAHSVTGPKPVRAPSPEAVSSPVAQPPGRLIIRSIGVDAAVLPVGVDASQAMDVTKTSYETGWYKLGPAPGNAGDAVIDGHLDWYDTPRAVFYRLKDVQVGDDIEVLGLDGASRHFKVTQVQTVPYNATVPGLFATDGPPRLSLITCGGTWSTKLGQYVERVVVDSAMVS